MRDRLVLVESDASTMNARRLHALHRLQHTSLDDVEHDDDNDYLTMIMQLNESETQFGSGRIARSAIKAVTSTVAKGVVEAASNAGLLPQYELSLSSVLSFAAKMGWRHPIATTVLGLIAERYIMHGLDAGWPSATQFLLSSVSLPLGLAKSVIGGATSVAGSVLWNAGSGVYDYVRRYIYHNPQQIKNTIRKKLETDQKEVRKGKESAALHTRDVDTEFHHMMEHISHGGYSSDAGYNSDAEDAAHIPNMEDGGEYTKLLRNAVLKGIVSAAATIASRRVLKKSFDAYVDWWKRRVQNTANSARPEVTLPDSRQQRDAPSVRSHKTQRTPPPPDSESGSESDVTTHAPSGQFTRQFNPGAQRRSNYYDRSAPSAPASETTSKHTDDATAGFTQTVKRSIGQSLDATSKFISAAAPGVGDGAGAIAKGLGKGAGSIASGLGSFVGGLASGAGAVASGAGAVTSGVAHYASNKIWPTTAPPPPLQSPPPSASSPPFHPYQYPSSQYPSTQYPSTQYPYQYSPPYSPPYPPPYPPQTPPPPPHYDGMCHNCHRSPCQCTSHSGGYPTPFMFPSTPPIPPIPSHAPQAMPYQNGTYDSGGPVYGYGPGFGFGPGFVYGPGFGFGVIPQTSAS